MIRRIGVAGAGTMGSGIAQAFATAGHDVWLFDARPDAFDRASDAIRSSLNRFVDTGTITPDGRDAALGRVHRADALTALRDVDYFVEAIAEEERTKCALLADADALLRPDVVLASNTSSIPIGRLAAATARPALVVGMHFMNPVPVMPLVEIVRGAQTAPETAHTATDLVRALGKTAVESADRPGFIANRILMPLINEAVRALAEGVGTAEAIDTVATLGFRHPMGPLALADLIGLDVCVAIMDVMRDGLGDAAYAPAPLLREKVAAGDLGRKSGHGFYIYSR